ncbi:MAG: porin [Prosthecobacter sp.]|jgi:hypothetical protein|uniref:DcaP family trimeric outer membrane transporter n=1 Tax=Prosthecobacter sp. TaxID=1965333 RepID=UPI0019E13A14|nr:DcaP family trimeric outer membrane transporter [Prosthecobacter sp.]MBE2285130.1 porin [Prosthecobacter sp.]
MKRGHHRIQVLCIALMSAGSATGVRAESQAAELEHLRTTVARMEVMMQQMQRQIAQLQNQNGVANPVGQTQAASGHARPPSGLVQSSSPASEAPRLSDSESKMRHRDTVTGDNVSAPRPGNAPIDPSYKGFMQIPETRTWIKLGGYAKVDSILDSTKMGNPNKFTTSGIPVEGEANYGKGQEYALHAKQSRFNVELRTPSPFGAVRYFYENDFFANSASPDMECNLRHFYGQVANVTVGQTWTTFFDPDTIPDTLDFAGPGVQSILRQPQVRHTFSPVAGHMHVALAVEQPKSDIGALPAGATTRTPMPDFTGHWRLEGAAGHVQVGGVARSLAWEGSTGTGDSAFAWGANISGVLHTTKRDSVVAGLTFGDGIGRYMQDLPAGSGAVVDAAGHLNTLSGWGGHVGYRHFWSERWRSEFSLGCIDMETAGEQGPKAYDRTLYSEVNLIWAPSKRFHVGLAYLHGSKRTRDGSEGGAHRIQLGMQFKLFE